MIVADWKRRIEVGQLATARGIAVQPADRLRARIIERLMCDTRVDLVRVCADLAWPLSDFAPEFFRLRELEADGLVRRRGFCIEATPAGRPFIRAIAAVFDPYTRPSESGGHVAAV